MFQVTKALRKIAKTNKRVRIVQGGTAAGKTVAILLYLIDLAQRENKSISVVSESLPHLKRGAMRDFLNIMKTHRYYREEQFNRTDGIYSFETGAYIEFFGADDPSKLRGPRRDILFINEANNVPLQTFEQLEVRTRDFVIIDYNPVSEFWAHTDVIPTVEHDFLKLTYRDNEALEESIVKSIESRKDKANWWKVYGLGEVGTKEGQVYDNWKQIDQVPEEAQRIRRWLDFGFTNDPTAIGSLFSWGHTENGRRRFIVDEEEYRTGMTNGPIADKILSLTEPETLVVADSQEPKSIEEIAQRGVQVIGAVKGQGSVNFGIDTVQENEIYVTKRSINILKEQRNYLWKVDRDGKPLNTAEDLFNHHMDGIRYAISDVVGNPELTEEDIVFV